VTGIDLALPVDGSTDVDPTAWIVVRHTLADVPIDDAPIVELRDADGDEVAGTSSWDGREVTLVPDAALEEGAAYSVVASRPGRDDYAFSFETAASTAGPAAPVLGPALDASFEYLGGGPEGDDPCGPIGFERYRVHLHLPAAEGTSGRQNVAYLVFQTRGKGVADEPVEVARIVDEEGRDQVHLELYRPANGVSGRACFRVLARDVTGPPSGTTDEACVRLEEGPFFTSICSAASGPPGPTVLGPGALLATAVLLLARGRLRS
jgi:hypothetical protein